MKTDDRFDWKSRVKFLQDHPHYNDAEPLGVRIIPKENSNWVASVYLLKPGEGSGLSFVYIEVKCKQDARDGTRGVLFGWEEMSDEEHNQTGAIFADKPANEIKSQFISSKQKIWLEVAGGDKVTGLSAIYGSSYLVLFREVNKGIPIPPAPDPDPIPDPTPDPDPPVSTWRVRVIVNQKWVASLLPDPSGNVTFLYDPRSDEN